MKKTSKLFVTAVLIITMIITAAVTANATAKTRVNAKTYAVCSNQLLANSSCKNIDDLLKQYGCSDSKASNINELLNQNNCSSSDCTNIKDLLNQSNCSGSDCTNVKDLLNQNNCSNSDCTNVKGVIKQSNNSNPKYTNIKDLVKQYSCPGPNCASIKDLLKQNSNPGASCKNITDLLKQYEIFKNNSCTNNQQDHTCPSKPQSETEAPQPATQPQQPATQPQQPATQPQQPETQPQQPATQPQQPETEPKESENSTVANSVSEYEKEVVRLVNEERAKYGLSALSLNTDLSYVARMKSQDMKNKNYFDHNSPTYGTPFEMMKAFGISYRTAGENIAKGYPTPQSVVNGWMNSPGHRANILNFSFKQIGVGYVASGNYWTQMFIG